MPCYMPHSSFEPRQLSIQGRPKDRCVFGIVLRKVLVTCFSAFLLSALCLASESKTCSPSFVRSPLLSNITKTSIQVTPATLSSRLAGGHSLCWRKPWVSICTWRPSGTTWTGSCRRPGPGGGGPDALRIADRKGGGTPLTRTSFLKELHQVELSIMAPIE